jgi:hypothetical protein
VIAYRAPAFAPMSLGRRMISQQAPMPASDAAASPPSTLQVRAIGTAFGLFLAAFSAGTAWVGVSTYQREQGALRYMGAAVAAAAGLSVLSELYGVGKLLLMSQTDLELWIKNNGPKQRQTYDVV